MRNILRRVTSKISRASQGGSANRQIFMAASTVGVVGIAVKLASVGKEVAVANYFGRGDALDAYLIALMAPYFITALVSNSMNAALIPTYVEVRKWKGPEDAQQLLSGAMLWSEILLVGFALLLAALAYPVFHLIAPEFGQTKLLLTTRLFYVLLPTIVLSGVSTNCSGILNTMKCFWLPAVTPVLAPTAMVLLLVLTRGRMGIWALPVGGVLGSVTECGLLLSAVRSRGVSIRPRWIGMTPEIRKVRAQYFPLLIGSLLTSGVTIVDQTMAAQLHSGSVAALGYGNRVIGMILTLTAISLGVAVIPHFSEMVAGQEWTELRRTLRTYTKLIIYVSVPVCLLIIVLSKPLVVILFRHGQFSMDDANLVARVQAFYAIQIPFFALGILFVRLLTALQRNDLVMVCAFMNLVLDIILNIICEKFLGLPGIALSTSLFYLGSLTFAVIACNRVLKQRSSQPLPSPDLTGVEQI